MNTDFEVTDLNELERVKAENSYLFSHIESQLESLKEIEKLRAEVQELRAKSEWQPIETAPKDGTSIMIYTDNCEYGFGLVETISHSACAFYSKTKGYFISDAWNDINYKSPTHWRPLPEAPEGKL